MFISLVTILYVVIRLTKLIMKAKTYTGDNTILI